MEKKDRTISVCKGIGIILMVIGHAGCPQPIHDFIYLFHMPLFFIITGFLFKTKYLETPYTFLRRKISTLYKPFLIFNLIALNIAFIKEYIIRDIFDFNLYINRFIKIICFTRQYEIFDATWFLKSLFISNIVVFILLYIQKKRGLSIRFPIIISILFLIIGYLIYTYKGIIIYDLQRELMIPILLMIGIILKKYQPIILYSNYLLSTCAFLMLLIASRFFTFEMVASEIVNPIVFLIFSIIGFYFIYSISKKINRYKLITYIGDNSLSILLLHQIGFYSLQIIKTGTLQHYQRLHDNNYWIIYSIYAVFFSLLLNFIYNKIKNIHEKSNNISSVR